MSQAPDWPRWPHLNWVYVLATDDRSMFRNMPLRIIFNEDVFKQLLLQWIVANDISFHMCKDAFFQRLCVYLAACQPDYSGVYCALPQTGNAIKRYILLWYQAMKEEVKAKLHGMLAKIHFLFDIWSGPNQYAYQTVVAHWVDRDGHLHAALLSLHRFLGAYSGLNQADHLWRTIIDYGIAPFVDMFNVDNATNNDTALMVLAERLRLAGYPSFDPVADRL